MLHFVTFVTLTHVMLQKKGGAIGHTYTERIRREDTNIHSLHFVTIRYIYTLKKAGAITHTHTDTQRGYNCSKVQMYIAHYVLLHFHTLCFISLKEAETIRHTFLKCTKFAFYIALYRVQ